MVNQPRRLIKRSFSNGGMFKLPKPLPGELIDLIMIREMRKAGVDPAAIFAFEVTLLWVTEDNVSTFGPKALAYWDAAQAEYWKRVAMTDGRIS